MYAVTFEVDAPFPPSNYFPKQAIRPKLSLKDKKAGKGSSNSVDSKPVSQGSESMTTMGSGKDSSEDDQSSYPVDVFSSQGSEVIKAANVSIEGNEKKIGTFPEEESKTSTDEGIGSKGAVSTQSSSPSPP